MKCTFLGTGTSMGVPVAGGFGKEMINQDPRNQRYRCSAWVRSEEASILIDASPEFRLQSIRSNIQHIDLVLITHEHMDHMAGIDDLRSYNYAQNGPIPLYSTKKGIESIRSRFDYMFGENRYPGSTSLTLNEMTGPMKYRDIHITPLQYNHGPIDVMGFRLNDFSYLTDVKQIPDKTKALVKGSKVMVLSGLRWEPSHSSHLTIPEAVEIAHELEVPMTYLIHMNSYVDHESSNKKLPSDVQLAYDQLEIEI